MTTFFLILAAYIGLVALFLLYPIRHPLRTESDYADATFSFWHLYYLRKYLNPITRAAKGSGLEEYFQNLPALPEFSQLKDIKKISITAVGDLWCQKDLTGDETKFLWDEVGRKVFGGDISIGNHEFVVQTKTGPKKRMAHCVSENGGLPLTGDDRFGEFSFMSLGNNHMNDSLSEGVINTCHHLDRLGISHAGASRTVHEKDNFPILTRNGIKVALLSYTFTLNGVAMEKGFEHGVNMVHFNALNSLFRKT